MISFKEITLKTKQSPFGTISPTQKNLWMRCNKASSRLCKVIWNRGKILHPSLKLLTCWTVTLKHPSASVNPTIQWGSKELEKRLWFAWELKNRDPFKMEIEIIVLCQNK